MMIYRNLAQSALKYKSELECGRRDLVSRLQARLGSDDGGRVYFQACALLSVATQ